uniref:Uncharacterized protein n=1 Tax=Nymphaea colorata TaxID=210225 RepID=A0A5K0VNG5_9MAGN
MSFSNTNAFILCSASSGQPMRGTPNQTLSSVEFHPQCDTNPPIAGCDRMASCGTHPAHTSPLSWVLSTNPAGSTSSRSASQGMNL